MPERAALPAPRRLHDASTRPPRTTASALTLGNAEVRLDELTAAYAAFARGGEWRAPRCAGSIAGAAAARDPVQLVSPRTAYWITDILADDDARAFIFGRGSQLDFPFPVAVKTGTSQAYHDNWTVGFSRARDRRRLGRQLRPHAADRLVRRDRRRAALPRRDAGGRGARRRRDHADRRRRRSMPPADLVETTICALSGMRARRCLSGAAARAAGAGRARRSPGAPCTLASRRRRRAGDDLAGALSRVGRRQRPAIAGEREPRCGWRGMRPRRRRGRATRLRHAAWRVRAARASTGLHVAHPADGTVFLIDPTLRAEFQAVPFRAVGAGGGQVSWTVNGRDVGIGRRRRLRPVAAPARLARRRRPRRPRPDRRRSASSSSS